MTPVALTIAGSDSGGGAGIQADLKTFAALGVYGVSAIAALTAQNTKGVTAIHDVPPDFIAAQINALFDDFEIGAVKIGMLSNAAAIDVVTRALDRHQAKNIVLDPVMIASSGDRLLAPEAIETLRRLLIPRARVITPNLPEAGALLGTAPAGSESEMEAQVRALKSMGAQAILIKGGHGEGADSVDLLLDTSGRITRLAAPRIATKNTHGTGCTLSSAIAAGLARGLDLTDAARAAKGYVTAAIAAADELHVGHGHGPLNHFHAQWRTP